jgi:DnaJ domain
MLESAFAEAVLFGADNAAVLAWAATVASMFAAFILFTMRARKASTNFALGRLETVELDRAILLYQKVVDRLRDIDREGTMSKGSPLARYNHRRRVRRRFSAELADLNAYAAHLRSVIMRLRRRPLQRYKSWLRIQSSRFVLSRSLAACILVMAVLIGWFCLIEQHVLVSPPLLTEEMDAVLAGFLELQPVRDRMLYANSMGAGFLPVIASYFYLYGRSRLRSEHRQQFRMLKEFAATDPDRLIHRKPADGARIEQPAEQPAEAPAESTWFSVLGLSPSASIDEIKQAYKRHIKQNHPDRVHDMSPSFRELAEAETKKLNSAYEEALLSLQHV